MGLWTRKKGPYENCLSRWNRFECSPLQSLIPCLEFTLEMQSNNLMYNPNKAIREKIFPVKIGKFSVKYYAFKEFRGRIDL